MRALSCDFAKSRSQQSGSVVFFFVTVLLPLISFLFSLSVDLTKFYAEREKLQEILDRAVMQSVRSLPFQSQAEDSTRAHLENLIAAGTVEFEIYTASDGISVLLNSSSKLTFPSLFGLDLSVPFSLVSKARISPADIFLAIDSSQYLAPALGSLWGDYTQWPASPVFTSVQSPHDSLAIDGERYLTQRCHNPVLTPLKESAVRIYDYLSSVTTHGVGVGFFPDDLGPNYLFESRKVSPGGFVDASGNEVAEAKLSTYSAVEGSVDITYVTGDANCAAIYDNDPFPQYRMPLLAPELNSPSVYQGPIFAPNLSHLGPGFWQLNSSYFPHLSAREAIWVRGVRLGLANISATLEFTRSQILSADYVADRGGLALSSRKIGVVIAGDLPFEEGVRFPDGNTMVTIKNSLILFDPDPVTSGEDQEIELYYVLFKHTGSVADFDLRVNALAAVFESYPSVHLIVSADPEQLSGQLARILTLVDRRVVLSR